MGKKDTVKKPWEEFASNQTTPEAGTEKKPWEEFAPTETTSPGEEPVKKKDDTIPSISGSQLEKVTGPSPSAAEDGTSQLEGGSLGAPLSYDVNPDLNPKGIIGNAPAQPGAPTNPFLEQAKKLTERVNTPEVNIPVETQGLSSVTSSQTAGDVNAPGTPFEKTTTGQLSHSFVKGASSLGAGIARLPEFAYDVITQTGAGKALNLPSSQTIGDISGVHNKVAQGLEGSAEDIGSFLDSMYKNKEGETASIHEYLNPFDENFDIGKGASLLGNRIAENLPNMMALGASGALGASKLGTIAAGTGVFGAQNKAQLDKEHPEISEEKRNMIAVGQGAAEGVVDAFVGAAKWGEIYADIFKKEGAEYAKQSIYKAAETSFTKSLARFGKEEAKNIGGEMAEQFTENVIARAGGIDTKLSEGVVDAGLIALGSSGGGVVTALDIARQHSDVKKAQELKKSRDAIGNELRNPLIPEDAKRVLKDRINKLNEDEDAHVKEMQEKHNSLPDNKKEEVDNILKESHKMAEVANNPDLSDEAREAIKDQIAKNDAKVDEIYKENEKLLKEKEKEKGKTEEKPKIVNQSGVPIEEKGLTEDEQKDLDYLSEIKKNLPLNEEEQKRFDELSKKQYSPEKIKVEPFTETIKARHSETKEDAEDKVSGQGDQPLNKVGVEKAKELAESVKDEGIKKVYSSDTERGSQTAEEVKKTTGAEHIVNENLRPWDVKDFEGMSNEEFAAIEKYFVENPDATEYEGKKIGESFNQYKDRVLKAHEEIGDSKENMIIDHSKNIRLWDAITKHGEWNEEAKKDFLKNEAPETGELIKPKTKENAVQEQSASSLLQHTQEGIGETRSERSGVEQGEQGKETTAESEGEKEKVASEVEKLRKEREAKKQKAKEEALPNALTEEEKSKLVDEGGFPVNPINRSGTDEEKLKEIVKLRDENEPIIKGMVQKIKDIGMAADYSMKKLQTIIAKANRPIKKLKNPRYSVEHINDAIRFEAVVDNYSEMQDIMKVLDGEGAEIINKEAAINQLNNPKEFGWVSLNLDLRMPNGQLVEFQVRSKEFDEIKFPEMHDIYEKWRDRDIDNLTPKERIEYTEDLQESNRIADKALKAYEKRLGITTAEERANIEKAVLKGEKKATEQKKSEEKKPTLTKQLLFTVATKYPNNEISARIQKLSERYHQVVDFLSNKPNDKSHQKEFERLQKGILSYAKKEIQEQADKLGVIVDFDTPYIGKWAGKNEPSYNLSYEAPAPEAEKAFIEFITNLAEETNQDAFIIEEKDPDWKDTDPLPLSEFSGDYLRYPQITIKFDDELSTEEKAEVISELNKSGLEAYSVDGSFFKVSIITDPQAALSEKEKHHDDTIKSIAGVTKSIQERTGLSSTFDETVRRSVYTGAENEGSDQQRIYRRERSNVPSQEKITPKGETVKISGQDFYRTENENGKGVYTNKKDGVQLPENTQRYRDAEERFNPKIKKEETKVTQEEEEKSVKKAEKPSEELADEEPLDILEGDDKETVHRLNGDIEAMRTYKEQGKLDAKFSGILKRAFKAKSEKKISRATFLEYKRKVKDIIGGKMEKMNFDKEAILFKIDELTEAAKKSLQAEGYKNVTLNGVDGGKLIDAVGDLVKRFVEAGFTVKEAIDKAMELIKHNPAYKKLLAEGNLDEKNFEKEARSRFKVPEEPKPKKTRRSKKSLSTNLYESENLSERVKEIVKKNGLDRDIYSHDEAKIEARKLIDEVGVAGALSVAKDKNSKIAGNVRMFILAHVLNDFHNDETKAKTAEEKDRIAGLQADLALDVEDLVIEMERQSTEAGRLIGSIGEFYKMSPLGIKKKNQKEIERFNTNKKKRMKSTNQKFDNVISELKNIDKKSSSGVVEDTGAPTKAKVKEIRKKRKELFSKLRGTFNNLGFAATPENIAKLQKEQLDIVFEIAKTYFDEGVVHAKDIIKKINKGLYEETGYVLNKNSNDEVDYILNKEYSNGKTLGDAIKEREAAVESKKRQQKMEERVAKQDLYEEKLLAGEDKESKRDKQLKVLKKNLGEKLKGKTREQTKKEYEKLLEVWDNDPMGTKFENAFYEKFGLTNVDSKEVQSKLDEFSKKIHAAPEGVLRNNEQIKYLNWLAGHRKQQYMLDVGLSAWYASILSSYETHARNMQYNGITSLVTMPALLAQKAIMKGNFKDVPKLFGEFLGSLGEGMKEAKAMVKTGQASRFEDVAASNVLERSPYTKWLVYPGRFLRAEDALATLPLYNMKQREIFSRIVDAKAKENGIKLTSEARQKAINDLMGYSEERKAYAEQQADKDIEAVYGPDWKENKEAVTNRNIRKQEIIEMSRPRDVREEARAWAKKALLTNKPEGVYGVMSDGIGHFLNYIPVLRGVMPFINVPLNIMNQIVERSPLGFIKVARGKVWFDREIKGKSYGRELTKEERKELALKAVNYTSLLALTAIGTAMAGGFGDDDDEAGFIVTGKEGGYFKNQSLQKGGGLEPYTVYIGGKDGVKFNYQNTPLASIFSPVGFFRDYQKFEEPNGKKNLTDGLIHSTFSFSNQIIDAASMKGMKELFKYMDADERKRMSDDGYKKEVAKKLSTLFPYSGLIKATTKDVKGLIGADEKQAQTFNDYLVNGLPFDYYQNDKIDAFGRPIKSQFDIPLFPYSKKNFSNDGEPVDKYYKLAKDKNYDLSTSFIKNKNAYTDKKGEFEMTQQELYDLNKLKGELAVKELERPRKNEKTLYNQMLDMSEERFKKTMDDVFDKATTLAKIQMFVLDGKMSDKKLRNTYRKYKKVLEKDKTKEKKIDVLK